MDLQVQQNFCKTFKKPMLFFHLFLIIYLNFIMLDVKLHLNH